jgi:hypothetical protein
MRSFRTVALMFGLLAVAAEACKSSGVRPDGSDALTMPDGAGDGATTSASCLDQPSDLPRPPTGRLPCELIPPGLRL